MTKTIRVSSLVILALVVWVLGAATLASGQTSKSDSSQFATQIPARVGVVALAPQDKAT